MNAITTDIIRRIEQTGEPKGLSFAEISKGAGGGKDLIRDWKRGKGSPTVESIAAMSVFLNVPVQWLAFGVGTPERADDRRIRRIPVRCRLEAGRPTQGDFTEGEIFDVAVPASPDLDGRQLYGALVRGPSMNRLYPDGTVVILERIVESARDLAVDRHYHVEAERPDGSWEASLKTLRRSQDGSIWMAPQSDDPAYQHAVPLLGPGAEPYRVVGRVVMSIRRE